MLSEGMGCEGYNEPDLTGVPKGWANHPVVWRVYVSEHGLYTRFTAISMFGDMAINLKKCFSMKYSVKIFIYIFHIIPSYMTVYTWKTVWTFFLSIMGFTRNGRFFCSIAYVGFWLWRVVQILWQHRVRTSSDSCQKRNFSPKWSKLGVVIGHPNLATNAAIFPTKFGCTHKIPVFFQHHVEKKQ